jgi:hypothetical protein
MHIKDRPITLGHKLRELITTKLNIYNVARFAQLWNWQEGAKNTLNPVPAMLVTLKDIWNNKYHFHGGSWLQTDNPFNITRDTKINFLNKIYNSYLHVLKPLTSKYGIYWRQSNGMGSFGSTHFKIWTLTYYRSHTEFDGSNHREWKSEKHLFSKHWIEYDFKYFTDDFYGCSEQEVSQEEYEKVRGC